MSLQVMEPITGAAFAEVVIDEGTGKVEFQTYWS